MPVSTYAGGVSSTTGKPGRPKAISREMLAEAACELFLERGYEQTSVADIAMRAGVGRSSFFNYASSKGELLWGSLDERIAQARLAAESGSSAHEAVRGIAAGFVPDALALAFANADAMQIEDHLEREAALRMWRIAALAAGALRREGVEQTAAEVRGGAYGAAAISAIRSWSTSGAGSGPLGGHLDRALAVIG